MTGGWRAVLLLALLGCADAGRGRARGGGGARTAWQRVLDEYSRATGETALGSGWSPFTVGGPLPLLVLPVPVQVPSKSCSADSSESSDSSSEESGEEVSPPPTPTRHGGPHRADSGHRAAPPRGHNQRHDDTQHDDNTQHEVHQDLSYFPEISTASSNYLVELYREQTPKAPQLPPAVFTQQAPAQDAFLQQASPPPAAPPAAPPGYPSRRPASSGAFAPGDGAAPSAPRFKRSLMIKAELTVHKSDYTEPYTAWWDASTGASRIDFHGGTASAYRVPQAGNRVMLIQTSLDRSGEEEVRRCMVSEPTYLSSDEPRNPSMPDLEQFTFADYEQSASGGRAERWRRVVRGAGAGAGGAGGGGPGEVLTHTHDFLLTRNNDNSATPLKYTVTVDSSILGAESDRYEHRYLEVKEQQPPRGALNFEINSSCGEIKTLNASLPVHRVMLEPLREFVQPQRDSAYQEFFNQYKQQYGRVYADAMEEAVRSNTLVENWRFVRSCSRQAAPFSVRVNFLSDRLDAELAELLGATPTDDQVPAERFPENETSARSSSRLPDNFDWRTRGGVTPVRYQESCASCWAFAVTASVEGALFIKTRKLQALSEKALVDCGHKYGAKGCKGTWPNFGFDYVQGIGLPALEEYTPYKAMVDKCRDKEVPIVTKISAHVNVPPNSIPALKVAIRKHAPSVVIIDGTTKSFVSYAGGVYQDERCGKVKRKLNHAVTAVGWGSSKGEPHFIVKNSWSAAWGEAGFARLHAPTNTCGVLTLPSYPRLETSDVLREDLLQDKPAAAVADE